MNQIARRSWPPMTAEAFLSWPGDGSGRRFQLVDGEVRPMSPASRIHGIIQANLAYLLIGSIRSAGLKLQVLTECAIVPARNANRNVRIPDVVVAPDDDAKGDQIVTHPLLIAEVLSPGNSDETRDNIGAYMSMPGVREVVVIDSGRIMAEVHRRDASGAWGADPEFVGKGGALRLSCVGLECVIDDVYANTWLTRGL